MTIYGLSSSRSDSGHWFHAIIVAKGIAIKAMGTSCVSSYNVVHNSYFNPVADSKAAGRLTGSGVVSVRGRVSGDDTFRDLRDGSFSARSTKRLLIGGIGLIEAPSLLRGVRSIGNSISNGSHFSTVFLAFRDCFRVLVKAVSVTLVSLDAGRLAI